MELDGDTSSICWSSGQEDHMIIHFDNKGMNEMTLKLTE